jgi:hypothetical protein
VLIDLRTDTPARSRTPPAAACPACKGTAEFDDLPEAYFSYAASRPKPAPPASASRLADRASESFFRAEKEVADKVTALWLHGDLDRTSRLKRAAEGLEGIAVLVADGLDSVNEDGLTALDMVAHTAGADVFLARVKPGPLAAIATSDVADRLRIVSVQPAVRCSKCSDLSTIEIFASDAHKLPPCRKCDGPCSVFPETVAATLARIAMIDAPAAVREYLATHAVTPWSRSKPAT